MGIWEEWKREGGKVNLWMRYGVDGELKFNFKDYLRNGVECFLELFV